MITDGQSDRLAGDSRAELADACRAIIEELASSTASSAAFVQATAMVQQAVSLLAGAAHGRPYEEAEGSLANYQEHIFIDHSPIVGPLNPLAPPLALEAVGTHVTAHATFGAAYEGPPGCVHGGFIAASFDEVLGLAQGMSGRPGMTARLTVQYRSPTPLHQPLRFVGDIDRIEGRKIFTTCELRTVGDDRLCAEAEGLFISMNPEIFQRLMAVRAEQDASDGQGS